MIELIQCPWSPYCLVQRRILEFARVPFKIVNIPSSDRSLVWKLTRERYYGVPILKDGPTVVFELNDDTQVIAKYLDEKLRLGLFPADWEGLQSIVWRFIENDVEAVGFKLNDIYWREFVPKPDQAGFVRHKERKFGRGCLAQWRAQRPQLLAQLKERLLPFEEMLDNRPFLLESRPRFVDFDLYGILANVLYTGHNRLPAGYKNLQNWYRRMAKLRSDA